MRAAAPPALRLAPRAGVRAAFTGRTHGNVSLVVGAADPPARGAAGPLVGTPPERAVFMEQVHGAAVAHVDASHAGRGLSRHHDAVAGVDALVTDEPGLALVVLTADCVPLLLAGEHAVGAVHAGRRGLLAGVVEAAVDALAALGQPPADLVAMIGPAIGPCCYELPAGDVDDAARRLPALRGRTTWGTPSLDLAAGVDAVLRERGVRRRMRAAACTRCGAAEWFSHRAAGDGRPPVGAPGRQASVVALAAGSAPEVTQGLPPGFDWLA